MPSRSRSPRTPPAKTSGRRPATTREHPVPLRTCVGCGRRAPKPELVRFAVEDGMLMQAIAGGRGAYTCRSAACFEQAVAQRAFARSLRGTVEIRPELARLYTEVSHG